jgi:hypothetical protein
MSLEGDFQLGWVRKTNKKYSKPRASVDINGSITELGGDVLTGNGGDEEVEAR